MVLSILKNSLLHITFFQVLLISIDEEIHNLRIHIKLNLDHPSDSYKTIFRFILEGI